MLRSGLGVTADSSIPYLESYSNLMAIPDGYALLNDIL
jgi:hypothetical protein